MDDITKDFNDDNGREKYGNISIPYAIELLDEIINSLTNGTDAGRLLTVDINTLKRMIKYQIDADTKEQLEKIYVMNIPKSDDTTKHMSFGDPIFRNQINIGELIKIVEQHLKIENNFIASFIKTNSGTVQGTNVSLDESELTNNIDNIDKYIIATERILGIIQKSINNCSKITSKDYSDVKIVISNCSDGNVSFGGLQQLIDSREELKYYQTIMDIQKEKGDITIIKKEIEKLNDELKSKYEMFNAKDEKELFDNVAKLSKLIGKLIEFNYMRKDIDEKMSFDHLIVYIYNHIICKIMKRPVENDAYKIIRIMRQIRDTSQITDAEIDEKFKPIINKCLSSYCGWLKKNVRADEKHKDRVKELCGFFQKIGETSGMECCKGTAIRKDKITLKILENTIVFLVSTEILGKIIKPDDGIIIFMYLWYHIGIGDIVETYEENFVDKKHINEMTIKFQKNDIMDLQKEVGDISQMKGIIEELRRKISDLTESLKIISAFTPEQLEEKIVILNKNIDLLNRKTNTFRDEIEYDLSETIKIYETLVKDMKIIDEFYKGFERTSQLYNYKMEEFFDVSNRNMRGGVKYTLNDFVKLINSNTKLTMTMNNKLMSYCKKSSELKSRYASLYNKMVYYNRIIMDNVLYNLYRLTTIRDIIKEKYFVNRYIKLGEIRAMKHKLDNIGTDIDGMAYKYAIIINIANKLVGNIVQKSPNHGDEICIDISKTNYIVDFMLTIIFCKNYSQK